MEGLKFEVKSRFEGSDEEILKIVKTIVAFANTEGGEILIKKVVDRQDLLDSARLDDKVNRYVQPRVEGIESVIDEKTGECRIKVPKSQTAIHVFIAEASYKDSKDRQKSAFYPGQVYVRHSSKTEPATAEDLEKMIRERVSEWLSELGKAMGKLAKQISISESGLPVRISETGVLTIAFTDPNREYPYTAKTLGQKIGKNQNWVAKAAEKLGLKNDRGYTLPINSSNGKKVIQWRYNEAAVQKLRRKVEEEPDFSPYRRD